MKAERDAATAGFVPVCSRVTGMHLHHPQGTIRVQAQTNRALAMQLRWDGGTARTYSGVCDGLGEVASSAGGGVGEVADAAGYAAPPDMNAPVNLSCLT